MYEGKVLSNIIGAPFDKYILDQLNIRSKKNALENRTNEDILYLANKTSWTRLVSSIRIAPAGNQTFQQFYANCQIPLFQNQCNFLCNKLIICLVYPKMKLL